MDYLNYRDYMDAAQAIAYGRTAATLRTNGASLEYFPSDGSLNIRFWGGIVKQYVSLDEYRLAVIAQMELQAQVLIERVEELTK